MSLRHSMLGLLAIEPTTGYDLTRRFDRSLRHAWHASHSQIYPELARMEAEGLVEVVGEGARRSRTWAVTDAGREELRRWVVEAEPNRGQRNETALRWFLSFLVEGEDRRAALRREIAYVEDELARMETVRTLGGDPAHRLPFHPTLDLALRLNTAMRDWLREQLDALDAGGDPAERPPR